MEQPRKMSSPSIQSAAVGFGNRRGNSKFSSAKFSTGTSLRPRKTGSLLFKSTRRVAARPTRTKGMFESLLLALTEGIAKVKEVAEDKRIELESADSVLRASRQHYFMDLEKHCKTLERKIRALEVHKDRIDELKDEYLLKLKLREGAFNLASALSGHTTRSAKEKLSETRIEQRELSEDLCDIEDELETKLGVFRVHIHGFAALSRSINGELVETQLKLATQKWKARCKISKQNQQQLWQDNEIFLLAKISDELFLKVVEVKKIQGNVHIGTIKCQTREFFSVNPQTVLFTFPNTTHTVKLKMDIKWSPMIGEDFIEELGLKTTYCYVGAPPSHGLCTHRWASFGNLSRVQMGLDHSEEKLREATVIQTESTNDSSTSSYQRTEVKTEKVQRSGAKKKERKKRGEGDMQQQQRASTPDLLAGREKRPNNYDGSSQNSDIGSRSDLTTPTSCHLDSATNSSSEQLSQGSDSYPASKTSQTFSLSFVLESVLNALEEPKEQYHELKALEVQLLRLDTALKGGCLNRAPSITLSESNALDSFDFLDTNQEKSVSHFSEGARTSSFSDFISLRPTSTCTQQQQQQHNHDSLSQSTESAISSQADSVFNESHDTGSIVTESTGCRSIDRALLQHLLYCEFLLQHLQSEGPLNHKLNLGLKKLYHEAEVVKELLNMAASPENVPRLEQLLPELAANDHLSRVWNAAAKRDEPLCVSCDLFIVVLDENYGQTLWTEFPQIANKVFTELLSRILGLDGDECDPVESKMCVTVFQFASYFLQFGSAKAVPKCLREIAQELKITQGLSDGDLESKKKIAALLPTYAFNHGALLAAAYLLADKATELHSPASAYLSYFSGNSPWRVKAVQYFIQALEHPDQAVRIGACSALGQLQAALAAPQLKYMAKAGFAPVRIAAAQSLVRLGEMDPSEINKIIGTGLSSGQSNGLYRTSSSEGVRSVHSSTSERT